MTTSAVSIHAGYRVKLTNLKPDEIALAADFLASFDLGRGDEMLTHTDDQRIGQEEKGWHNSKTDLYPRLPIMATPVVQNHRDKCSSFEFPFNMLVADPVTRAQRAKIPKAQAACDEEWAKLLRRETWDPHSVKEWKFVASRSRESGVKVHVANLFEICVVKGAELDDSNPQKKYKGRAVLDGS